MSQLFQLIFGIVINCCMLCVFIFSISIKLNTNLGDTFFVVASIALFIGICFNILGNSTRLSIQYLKESNTQYVSKVDSESHKQENKNDKTLFSTASIISGIIIISSIVMLIIEYFT